MKVPLDLWDEFGRKCHSTGTSRRWAILMLISKFCGAELHTIERRTPTKEERRAKRQKREKARMAPTPAPVQVETTQPAPVVQPAAPSPIPDLGSSF